MKWRQGGADEKATEKDCSGLIDLRRVLETEPVPAFVRQGVDVANASSAHPAHSGGEADFLLEGPILQETLGRGMRVDPFPAGVKVFSVVQYLPA